METGKAELSKHRISGYDTFYLSNFITAEEEQYLIRKIVESPQPRWKILAKRRLQIWGGDISAKGTLLAQPLPSFVEKFPDIVSRIKATGAFEGSPHKGPNHIIMNEYLPGQGIMPHEDGPKYHPVVATISLGSHAIFHYYEYQSDNDDSAPAAGGGGKSINRKPVMSILLEPRSLVISSGAMYTTHLHGIDGVDEDMIATDSNSIGVQIANTDQLQTPEIIEAIHAGVPIKRGNRYSLTCRDVERVAAINSSLRR